MKEKEKLQNGRINKKKVVQVFECLFVRKLHIDVSTIYKDDIYLSVLS